MIFCKLLIILSNKGGILPEKNVCKICKLFNLKLDHLKKRNYNLLPFRGYESNMFKEFPNKTYYNYHKRYGCSSGTSGATKN